MSGSGRASPNIPQTTRLIAPVKPPKRQDSFPHTPSALSQVSSPGTSNMSPAVKRPLAPAPSMDSPGSSARNQDRRQSTDVRPHSITDPVTGKKKRVSLSCAQCESLLISHTCIVTDVPFLGAKRKQKVGFSDVWMNFRPTLRVTDIQCNREYPCQHCKFTSLPILPMAHRIACADFLQVLVSCDARRKEANHTDSS